MSNPNAPFGLRPINENGTPWNGQGRMVAFHSNYASNVFLGDPLVPNGDTDANGVPYMILATAGAGNQIASGLIGMCNGPAGSGFTLTRDLPVYRQASILNYGFICDDISILYAIQEDSNGGAIAAANAGYSNGNLVAGAGGSTVTGYSSWQLQSSSVGSGNSTYQVRLLGLLRGPDNVIGNYAKWIVRLNESVLNAPTAGL